MSDYDPLKVDAALKIQERIRKVPAPWKPRGARVTNEQIRDDAKRMSEFGNQETFVSFRGGYSKTNEDTREENKELFEKSNLVNKNGWPLGREAPSAPTWWYTQWLAERDDPEDPLVPLQVTTLSADEKTVRQERGSSARKAVSNYLILALRRCRRGDINEHDAVWKEFSLHHIANGLRRGSPAMHQMPATTMTNGFGMRRQHLMKLVRDSAPDGDRMQDMSSEIHMLGTQQDKCKDAMHHAKHDQADWKTPVFSGRLRQQWRKVDATRDLRDRTKCALHNLGNMMFQGTQLLTYVPRCGVHKESCRRD